MTICLNCKFHYNGGRFSGNILAWYNHFCTASLRTKAIDPVTGEENYIGKNDLGQEYFTPNSYSYCRDINKGNCPLYQKKERET